MLIFIVLLDFSPFIFIIMAAAVIHECGHLIAMRICGVKTERITLYPFGLDIRTLSHAKSYRQEILIKSAGIIVNIAAVIISVPFIENIYISFFAVSNFLLVGVNIMPVKSLDGGGILENLLLMYVEPAKVNRIMKTVSFIFIVILWILASYTLFYTNYNFSLFAMCMYLFASIFIMPDENQ